MFLQKAAKRAPRSRRITAEATLIAKNTAVYGDVQFDDQLFVNGRVEGNVTATSGGEAMLVLSDLGTVKGEIRAPFVVINGSVDGDVHAHNRVELAANACVSGNVYYRLIEMQLGARVDGQLVHVDASEDETLNVHPLGKSQQEAPAEPDADGVSGAAAGDPSQARRMAGPARVVAPEAPEAAGEAAR